jgi:hypothetical protein
MSAMSPVKLIPVFFLFYLTAGAQQTTIKYLSGTDKDHTVNWDFFVPKEPTVASGQRSLFHRIGNFRGLAVTIMAMKKIKMMNMACINIISPQKKNGATNALNLFLKR